MPWEKANIYSKNMFDFSVDKRIYVRYNTNQEQTFANKLSDLRDNEPIGIQNPQDSDRSTL